MITIHRISFWLLVTMVFFFVGAQHSFADTAPSLASVLEPIRAKYHLPALAGAIFNTEGVVEMEAVGVRKVGMTVPVTTDDLWHLGSDTKAMTAMLVGTYVAEKKLSWHTKVVSFFPEIADKVPKKIRKITIAQVLSHEAGLQGCDTWIYSDKLSKTNVLTGTIREQRINAARSALLSPKYDPGTFHYSNVDYILIGAVLEKIGGKSWEDLMRQRIFQPLGMKTAGFGGTGTVGQIDQPWPHFHSNFPAPTNGPTMDIPAFWGPAGEVHASMGDWAKFLTDQLNGGFGGRALLPENIYQAMQTASPNSESGYGWGVSSRPWAEGKALTHEGSNGMNFCVCWLAPIKKIGVLVCCNQGDNEAAKACDDVSSAFIQRYLAKLKASEHP